MRRILYFTVAGTVSESHRLPDHSNRLISDRIGAVAAHYI
ncbi:uncharacterized protein METZ01_LOCUS122838 [marine metagenome]|uniref:Uncharacterized protein n=1 Tax=marine metagenome TaxID=408172 RepID=A0A381XYY6_9ZZZZ